MNIKGRALSLGVMATAMLGNIGTSSRNRPPFPTIKPKATFPKRASSRKHYSPPVSMSEGTAYLYSKKPNIQYWQNKYGEKVIDKSVSQLQAMGI